MLIAKTEVNLTTGGATVPPVVTLHLYRAGARHISVEESSRTGTPTTTSSRSVARHKGVSRDAILADDPDTIGEVMRWAASLFGLATRIPQEAAHEFRTLSSSLSRCTACP